MKPTVDIDSLATPLQKVKAPDPVIALGTPVDPPAPPAAPAVLAPPVLDAASPPKTKLTVRLDPDVIGRGRGAYLMELGATCKPMTWSDWVGQAIEVATARVEDTYNGGSPVELVDTDVVPKGRMDR